MASNNETKAMVELANGTATPDKKSHLLSKDDYDNTKQVISVLVELLETFGFDASGYKPSDAVKVWAPHVKEIGWMKWAKYKIAAYFSYHNHQILPKQPTSQPDNAGDLLTGKACRFMRNYLRRYEGDSSEERLERASFLTSVLQSKKGMPRPDEAALEKSKMETFKTLTTFVPPKRYAEVEGKVVTVQRTDSENRIVDFGLIVEEVRRTTTELFRGVEFDPSRDIRSVMPSLSANYNRTRGKLGTLGHMQANGDFDMPLEEQVLPEFDIAYPHLEDYIPDHRNTRSAKTSSSMPSGLIYQPEESREGSGEPTTSPFITAQFLSESNLKNRFNTVFYRALRKAQEEEPLVELVSLPEALKVRTISKGPPYTYYVLKQVQKFMWSVLKDHPVFALIGQTVDSDILNNVIGGQLSDGLGYLSGDYKAATDNLRGELSEAAWLTFCDIAKVPQGLAVLGLRALTGHTVQDPESGQVLEQQAGQLMGSIISFPILCIVNAAVCRLCLEIDNCKQLSLGRRTRGGIWKNVPRLLINGDDCLFVVTERGRKVWGAVAQLAGLEESVGKVYYATDFANVNSTNFIRVYDSFTQVPYVNLGLLFGYKRSGGQASVLEADFDLGARQKELFTLSGRIRDGVLWKHFKKHNASSLEFYSKLRIPWFVPKEYGGVGLMPVKDFNCDADMSREDQMICRAMIQRTFPHAPRPRIMKDHVELMLHEQVLEITERVLGYRAQKSYSLQPVDDKFDVTGLYLYLVYCMPDSLKTDDGTYDESTYQHELLAQNAKVWSYYWKRLSRCPPPFTEGLQARYPVHDVALSW